MDATTPPAERLERGEPLVFPAAPFPLPAGDDLALLCALRLRGLSKNVTYNPHRHTLAGTAPADAARHEAALDLFRTFSARVSAWLDELLPAYRGCRVPDRATFHPEEEATRQLRLTARNDLLHIDAFPTRPSAGRRILRVFANVNPSEPRVWVTSEPFARLLPRYAAAAGLPEPPAAGWLGDLRRGVLRFVRPDQPPRTAYDAFMLRLHDHLKGNDKFQERAAKKRWVFPPGAVWLAMTDACAYAVLRGRFALEHSFFVESAGLALPDEAPAALLRRYCEERQAGRAA